MKKNQFQIHPKNPQQTKYLEAIKNYDLVFAVGPCATGKTFLAVASALEAYQEGKVKKIVITRPVLEAGEKLGFLPGTLYEKIEPYLRPIYDAFFDLLDFNSFEKIKNLIEIVPLAYMRGKSIKNSFIILDEAQNTTRLQMKMFLTRIGEESKVIVTGDPTQIDLDKEDSGLLHVVNILKDVEGISFINFSEDDVLRHSLVKKIIKAYNATEEKINKAGFNVIGKR